MFYTLIGADIIMGIMFLFKLPTLPPQVPLFYSKPLGEEQLVDLWFIFVLPVLLHLFYVVNIGLYRRFFLGNEFIKKLVESLNLFLIITVTFIFVKILFLIG